MTVAPQDIPILDLRPQFEALRPEIMAAITRVIESGQFIMGPDVAAFEREAAAYLGVKHAVGLNSGTDALFIGLRALGIGPGDEVITTTFSFFATAEAISHVGATPVFVDIDPDTFNLDPNALEAAITERTKAIIPVHLYGRPCEMGRIMSIANRFGLRVIEDCAQSFGARYAGRCQGCDGTCDAAATGRMTGTIGDIGAYSFFPSKNLSAYGDGGMLVTNDDRIAETTRMLRAHGAKTKYVNEAIGYNSRLDTIQAAVLRVKLPHIDAWSAARRAAAQRYDRLLEGIPGLVRPQVVEGHVFHQYTVRLTAKPRDEVQASLKRHGIGTMVYYPIPQHQLPAYADTPMPTLPHAEAIAGEALSLPMYPELTAEAQQAVADTLRRILT